MKSIALALVIYVAAVPLAFAATPSKGNNSSFDLRAVYTSNDVGFSVAADASGTIGPDELSVLDWTDMTVWGLEGELRYGIGKHFRIIARGQIGGINDGLLIATDYSGSGRTGVVSQSRAAIDGSYMWEADLSFGWEFNKTFSVPLWRIGDSTKRVAFASDIRILPFVGYSYSTLEIEFTDGIQLIPDDGPFAGLNSSYIPEWQGIVFGVDSRFRIAGSLYLGFDFKYWPRQSFEAEGFWNLRSDLSQPTGFVQSASGDGYDGAVSIEWLFSSNKALKLTYSERDMETSAGIDEVRLAGGVETYTRLNETTWKQRGWFVSIQWGFDGLR